MERNERARAQVFEAVDRYRQAAAERQDLEQQQQREDKAVVDTEEQVLARVERLMEHRQVPAEVVVESLSDITPESRHTVLERIIDKTSNLQSVSFLTRGARTTRATARISLDDRGRFVPIGTGFLVSPTLLLTNNHVLPDAGEALRSVVEFNCEVDADGMPVTVALCRLDPQTLFLTDGHLDYTLVAVRPRVAGTRPGEEFGWNQLIAEQGKVVTGESINVVGHPMGRLKEIAIRNGTLLPQHEQFLQYTTDTQQGSSGSGVYNDQWEVVALHHAGVPRTDANGHWLKRDGTVMGPGDTDADVHWVANEGARVSVLLEHIDAQPITDAQRALLDEMMAATPQPVGTVTPVGGTVTPVGPSLPTEAPVTDVTERAGARGAITGVRARGAPRRGDTHLVFIHGRSQQGKDPERLRRSWTAGLSKGLVLSGNPGVDARDIWFPFYGDALVEAISAREAAPVDRVDVAAEPAEALAPSDPGTRQLYEALIEEAAAGAGFPAQDDAREGLFTGLVGRLQDKLTWVAGMSRLDDIIIAAIFRDVAIYLDRDRVRAAVLDAVLETMPSSGRVVIVGHSLGTVVAMDVLTRLADEVDVVQLVTAGSPLGLDTVFNRLLSKGPHWPVRLTRWLNAWCPGDAVTIGCPLADDWGNRLVEVVVNNASDRIHSIEEYLADPRVAGAIGTALERGRR
jgi:V8-like Glu-specific endopeptidase